MITINDLKPGDIIILRVAGVPHPAIYSPIPGKQGDLIQMGYGIKRSGAIKSTLTRQLLNLKKNVEVHVIRSKHLDGAAIAAQAEFWMRQGVSFDERRLGKSLLQFSGHPIYPSSDANILEYLKFAARRETLPVKSQVFPYNYSSALTLFGVLLNVPSSNHFHLLSRLGITRVGQKLIKKGTNKADRPKGLTCAGFVLACIGAVALKDDIGVVTEKSGWVSLKYAGEPEHANQDYLNALRNVKNEIGGRDGNCPGLHHVLTEEQLEKFDIQRLKEKITPLLANLSPHQPSSEEFFSNIISDSDNWDYLGCLDKTVLVKGFDREAYHQECREILDEIKRNRDVFSQKFGPGIFSRKTRRCHPGKCDCHHGKRETVIAEKAKLSSRT